MKSKLNSKKSTKKFSGVDNQNTNWLRQVLLNKEVELNHRKEHLLHELQYIEDEMETLKVAYKQYKKLQKVK